MDRVAAEAVAAAIAISERKLSFFLKKIRFFCCGRGVLDKERRL
jgi:hypothetical protein